MVGDYVKGLIERMGLGSFEIERIEQEGVEVFRIEGDAAQGLTGGDGRSPDAIQLLAIVLARSGDKGRQLIVAGASLRARGGESVRRVLREVGTEIVVVEASGA